MELFEDYIEDIKQEDIATEEVSDGDLLEYPENHYQTSIQFYTSFFLYQDDKQNLVAFKRNIERLARQCPQVQNEYVGPVVGWGKNLKSYDGLSHIFEDDEDGEENEG